MTVVRVRGPAVVCSSNPAWRSTPGCRALFSAMLAMRPRRPARLCRRVPDAAPNGRTVDRRLTAGPFVRRNGSASWAGLGAEPSSPLKRVTDAGATPRAGDSAGISTLVLRVLIIAREAWRVTSSRNGPVEGLYTPGRVHHDG